MLHEPLNAFAFAATRSIDFLEAPVTNAVDFAALGRLSIFVGGDAQIFAQFSGEVSRRLCN